MKREGHLEVENPDKPDTRTGVKRRPPLFLSLSGPSSRARIRIIRIAAFNPQPQPRATSRRKMDVAPAMTSPQNFSAARGRGVSKLFHHAGHRPRMVDCCHRKATVERINQPTGRTV